LLLEALGLLWVVHLA
jgi:hypothetical protein